MSEHTMATGPLQGLRVLDISTMLAGPYGATLLGDLGADVIRVESHYYAQVATLKADIVWIGVTAFGPDGPYAGRPGIDFLAQGYAGVLALNGDPDGEPVRTGFPAVDVITSLLVANAAQAALRVRDRTGAGQRVEVATS